MKSKHRQAICLQSLCFVSRVAGRHGKVRCKIEGRSFLAAQVPVERSQEGTEFGCDLEECNVYRCGLPSFSSVQHVALCSFILSVVHLVAQLSRSLWFSNVILCGSCNALSCLGRKCGVLHFLHLAGVLLESPSSGLCFNVMADCVADAARKRIRIGATAPCLRPCVAGQGRNKHDFWTTISRTVLPVYKLAFWLEVARCIVPKSLSHT